MNDQLDPLATPLSDFTEGEISLVKWQYRQNGDFFNNLWEAISRADGDNLARLAKGFPSPVEAYKRFAHEAGWWEELEKKAASAHLISASRI